MVNDSFQRANDGVVECYIVSNLLHYTSAVFLFISLESVKPFRLCLKYALNIQQIANEFAIKWCALLYSNSGAVCWCDECDSGRNTHRCVCMCASAECEIQRHGMWFTFLTFILLIAIPYASATNSNA